MIDATTILFAISGGVIPALIWLFFWLKQDSRNPEPSRLIFLTFFFGMLAAPVALTIQLFINHFFFGNADIDHLFENSIGVPVAGITMILLWAFIEELSKYLAARNGGLNRDENDEAIDDMIYLITAALGFSAVENALFIFGPLLTGDTELAITTGNLRFIGATLLHVASVSIIGAARAFSHFKSDKVKKIYVFSSFILAVALHTAFNLIIIKSAESAFLAFSIVWIIIIIIILIFERVKKIFVEKIQ